MSSDQRMRKRIPAPAPVRPKVDITCEPPATVRLKADTTYVRAGFSRVFSAMLAAAVLCAGVGAFAQSPKYNVGRTPTDEDTRALGIVVAPDGTGLPAGSGTAVEGRAVFTARCASCHGPNGDGGDGPALVGGKGTLATAAPKKTVGSYWPYATTVWDYVNRAMPFNQPGTLSPGDVYAVSAYVLFLNDIVTENQVLDARSLPLIKMPNRDGFVSDPRPDVPLRRSE
jgi:mono/diheme cytochrome c family protein